MSLFDPSPLQPFVEKLVKRSDIGADEQRAILALPAEPAEIEANRDLMRTGERADHATFVVGGLVGGFGQNRQGGRQITAVHLPGDMPNLRSVVAPDACAALQALTVTKILRVPHVALREVTQRFPAIGEAFWRECAIEAAVLAEWVVNVGRRDAKSRIAHLLCEIACRMNFCAGEMSSAVPFPATQNHIADMAGLTPVHVNRSLQALRNAGVVDLRGRTIKIRDWNQLATIGEFHPGYLGLGRRVRVAA